MAVLNFMGHLTTHVLDTAHGSPAQGMRIELFRVEDDRSQLLLGLVTNADGRCDEPLLKDHAFNKGIYQLEFHVGNYFRKIGVSLTDPAFLDVVPIRFGVAKPKDHYHVPLLISPYSYSTYRGS